MRPASEAEKQRLNQRFASLCAIPSPFGHEDQVAAHVTRELEGLGLGVEADASGNLLTRVRGRSERTVLLCAHLDTVEVHGQIEPVLVDGGWENAHDTILGADNKAAVAVFLEVARRVSVEGSPVALELLLTVEEEDALAGAKAFDASVLRADFGYVFDHATPIGEIVTASPTYYRLSADFHGRAAHAGIRPEAGRSAVLAAAHAIAAMPHGRIDEQTTANVGSIHGGSGSTNVVPERCCVLAEARSLDPQRVEAVVALMIDAVQDGAGAANATSTWSARSSSTATGPGAPHRRCSLLRRPCAGAATSRAGSSPAAAQTRTCSRSRASSASTWPTAPSTTTSQPSV